MFLPCMTKSFPSVPKWSFLSNGSFFGGENSYLHLIWADVELAEDVAQEVLDLVPGVDTVGAVQHNDDVHVGGAPCRWVTGSGMP